MSGFAVGFGRPAKDAVVEMMKAIGHRGPDVFGMTEEGRVTAGQNYLRSEVGGDAGAPRVPVGEGARICYDGQMGNTADLCRTFGTEPGAFAEERVILELYRRFGKDLLHHLDDAVFAFVIADGDSFLAARDVLGIKTLFYGRKDDKLFLASELKSLVRVTDDVHEFPPGCWMDESGRLTEFARLPEGPSKVQHTELEKVVPRVRDIIDRSIRNRVDFARPTGALLSGGMDSSVISLLGSRLVRERLGSDMRLKTFAVGVGESEDIQNARIMAEHIGSEHHETIVDLNRVLEVLPDVVYHLESFDPSLVRSAVTNYLVSGFAREFGIEVLLSGEGGDEIFCGYRHLKSVPPEELTARQMECFALLHNNASLRLDRMNQCHSLKVVAPLISGELFRYSLSIPPEFKMREENGETVEKWIFRKAYEADLPEPIFRRVKAEFSQGSGSAAVLPAHFDRLIPDDEFNEAREQFPVVRSKEELYYFRIFTEHFGAGKAVETVGQWVSLN